MTYTINENTSMVLTNMDDNGFEPMLAFFQHGKSVSVDTILPGIQDIEIGEHPIIWGYTVDLVHADGTTTTAAKILDDLDAVAAYIISLVVPAQEAPMEPAQPVEAGAAACDTGNTTPATAESTSDEEPVFQSKAWYIWRCVPTVTKYCEAALKKLVRGDTAHKKGDDLKAKTYYAAALGKVNTALCESQSFISNDVLDNLTAEGQSLYPDLEDRRSYVEFLANGLMKLVGNYVADDGIAEPAAPPSSADPEPADGADAEPDEKLSWKKEWAQRLIDSARSVIGMVDKALLLEASGYLDDFDQMMNNIMTTVGRKVLLEAIRLMPLTVFDDINRRAASTVASRRDPRYWGYLASEHIKWAEEYLTSLTAHATPATLVEPTSNEAPQSMSKEWDIRCVIPTVTKHYKAALKKIASGAAACDYGYAGVAERYYSSAFKEMSVAMKSLSPLVSADVLDGLISAGRLLHPGLNDCHSYVEFLASRVMKLDFRRQGFRLLYPDIEDFHSFVEFVTNGVMKLVGDYMTDNGIAEPSTLASGADPEPVGRLEGDHLVGPWAAFTNDHPIVKRVAEAIRLLGSAEGDYCQVMSYSKGLVVGDRRGQSGEEIQAIIDRFLGECDAAITEAVELVDESVIERSVLLELLAPCNDPSIDYQVKRAACEQVRLFLRHFECSVFVCDTAYHERLREYGDRAMREHLRATMPEIFTDSSQSPLIPQNPTA